MLLSPIKRFLLAGLLFYSSCSPAQQLNTKGQRKVLKEVYKDAFHGRLLHLPLPVEQISYHRKL
jgi:hypothetical protein